MQYRVGEDVGELKFSELSIKYSHLGGRMCYEKGLELPALKCAECGRNLQCLMQFVSPVTCDNLHRIIYVFICNQSHYMRSLKVLTYNKNMPVPERDTSASVTKTTSEYDENIQLDGLMDLASQMGQQSVMQQETKEPAKAPIDEVVFCTRQQRNEFSARDVRSEACEQKMQDFFIGEIDVLIDGGDIKFTDALLQTFPQAVYIAGHDRNPLTFQKCCAKMEQGVFDEEKYKVSKKAKNDEEESGDSDHAEGSETEVVVDNAPDYIHDQRCDCAYCKKFHEEFVHELDIFSRIIWVLKMHEQEDHADFKALYIYGARTMDEGLYEGRAFCLPEEEDANLEALLKELQGKKKQAAQPAKQ